MSSFKNIPLSNQFHFILFILLLVSTSVFSEWSQDPYDPLLVYDASRVRRSVPEYCRIIPDSEGGCIIAWHERRLHQIRVQKLSRDGEIQWDQDGIPIRFGLGDDYWGAEPLIPFLIGGMVSDGDGGAIILWNDYGFSDCIIEGLAYNNEIYARRITADGEVLWGDEEGLLICTFYPEEANQRFVSPALSDGEGGCMFAWSDELNPNDSLENGIYAQRISEDGELLWGDDGIRVGQWSGYWEPYVFLDEEGGMFVGTADCLQHVTADGELWDEPPPSIYDGWHRGGFVKCRPGVVWCRMSQYDEVNFRWRFCALNQLTTEGELLFDIPGVPIITPANWDSLKYTAWMITDNRGGCYVHVYEPDPPYDHRPLRLQQAFHVDAEGNMLWGVRGIHLPFNFESRGISTGPEWSDALGFYCGYNERSDNIYRSLTFKVGYDGDFLWGEEGVVVWADSLDGDIRGGGLAIDTFGNQFRVRLYKPPRGTTNIYAWVVSPDGVLGEVVDEIRYPPSAFNLLSPENGDTLNPTEPQTFTWQRSIDLNPEDSVSYAIWFQAADDSISFTLADTTTDVRLDSLIDDPGHNLEATWWVNATSDPHIKECNERFSFMLLTQDVSDMVDRLPREFAIQSVYPNPFNSEVRISYSLNRAAATELNIFDLAGRKVVLSNYGHQSAGWYRAYIDASDLPSGVYVLQLAADNDVRTAKLLCIR